MTTAKHALAAMIAAGLLVPSFASAESAAIPSLLHAKVLQAPDTEKFIAEDGKRVGGPFRYGVVVDIDRIDALTVRTEPLEAAVATSP